MARPKRHSSDLPAYTRIENAFWQLLEEMPFDKITVSALSRRAEVNHNMIYYYFDNIQDMAQKLFDAIITLYQRPLGLAIKDTLIRFAD